MFSSDLVNLREYRRGRTPNRPNEQSIKRQPTQAFLTSSGASPGGTSMMQIFICRTKKAEPPPTRGSRKTRAGRDGGWLRQLRRSFGLATALAHGTNWRSRVKAAFLPAANYRRSCSGDERLAVIQSLRSVSPKRRALERFASEYRIGKSSRRPSPRYQPTHADAGSHQIPKLQE